MDRRAREKKMIHFESEEKNDPLLPPLQRAVLSQTECVSKSGSNRLGSSLSLVASSRDRLIRGHETPGMVQGG